MSELAKPIFNKRIFWDVVFEKIDYDDKANFVIERVFERGDVEESDARKPTHGRGWAFERASRGLSTGR